MGPPGRRFEGASAASARTRSSAASPVPGLPHGVPYAMTEEFVAVYRMHPLIPDELSLRRRATTTTRASYRPRRGIEHENTVLDPPLAMTDLLYSFGTVEPGAIALHNFPNHLRTSPSPTAHARPCRHRHPP